MSSYSPYLEYFAQRLEGLSVGLFRLEMQNQTSSIASQSILRVTLPSNALVDMHSLAWHFNCKCKGGVPATDAVAGSYLRLPDKIESLIQRVEVTVGGVSVAAGANFYNTLVQAKARVDGEKRDLGRNHPVLVAPTNPSDNYVEGVGGQQLTDYSGALGAATVAPANEAPFSVADGGINKPTAAPFCVTNWEGFLGTCEPRILDTSLIGDVVIVIYLERPDLCIAAHGRDPAMNTTAGALAAVPDVGASVYDTLAVNPNPNYEINNSYFTVKCYSLATGVYDAMIAQQLQQAGALECGFKQYFSFRDTNNGTTRFQVASQSIDRIITAHQFEPAGGSELLPVARSGVVKAGGAGSVALPGTQLPTCRRGADLQVYHHPRNNFTAPYTNVGDQVQFQYTLNGAMTPQFRASIEDMYTITKQASKKECNDDQVDNGLDNWRDNDFVHAVKFTMDAPNARFIQGLDSRSVSLNGYYNVYNGKQDAEVTVFLETTSSLLISEGRQIEIIQ